MQRWDEKNAKLRSDAYELDNIDGGVVCSRRCFMFSSFISMTYISSPLQGCHDTFYSKCSQQHYET